MITKIRFARDLFSDSVESQQSLDEKIQSFHKDFYDQYYAKIMARNMALIKNASDFGLKDLFATIENKLDESVYDISQNLPEM